MVLLVYFTLKFSEEKSFRCPKISSLDSGGASSKMMSRGDLAGGTAGVSLQPRGMWIKHLS